MRKDITAAIARQVEHDFPTRAPVRPRIPLTSPEFEYTPARAIEGVTA